MAIAIVEELWTRIRAAIDDKIVAAVDAADRAEIAAAAVAFTEDPAGAGLYTFPTTAGA